MRDRLQNRVVLLHLFTELQTLDFFYWKLHNEDHSHSVCQWSRTERFCIDSLNAWGLDDGTYKTMCGTVHVKDDMATFSETKMCKKKLEEVRCGTKKVQIRMTSDFHHTLLELKKFRSCAFATRVESVLNSQAHARKLPHFAEGFYLAAQRMMEIRQNLDVKRAVSMAVHVDRKVAQRLERAKKLSHFKVSIDCEDDGQHTPTIKLKLQICSFSYYWGRTGEHRDIIYIMSSDGQPDKLETVYGLVFRDGSCWFTQSAIQHRVMSFLQKWNDECVDGVFFDWLFGVSKGTCIFCNRPLSNETSKSQGSGAICRTKYLPLWLRLKDHIGYTVDRTETHVAGLHMPAVQRQFVVRGQEIPQLLMSKSKVLRELLEGVDNDFDLTEWLDENILSTDGLKRAFREVCSIIQMELWFIKIFYMPPEDIDVHDLVYVLDYLGLHKRVKVVLGSDRTMWMLKYTQFKQRLSMNLRY